MKARMCISLCVCSCMLFKHRCLPEKDESETKKTKQPPYFAASVVNTTFLDSKWFQHYFQHSCIKSEFCTQKSILNMYLPVDLLSRSNGYREIWTVGNEEWLAGRVSKTGVSSWDCGPPSDRSPREQSQRASGCDPVQSQQTALYYNATGHHREQRAIYGNLVLWLPRLAVCIYILPY